MQIQKQPPTNGTAAPANNDPQAAKNREVVTNLSGLVEVLFDEVSVLPLSDGAKEALVIVMIGDMMKRKGRTFTFNMPKGI
ncbi:MAG: hypothetical protein NTX82_02480 [Candidatus Parcubacteria bacterium]|nr:hypothetical protein [Candidatus Parcubacteria bacterium]